MSDQNHISTTKPKDVRRFGIIAFFFFGALCAVGLWRNRPVPVYLFGALSLLGLGFIAAPLTLTPLYNQWIRLAHFIGRMINAIILGIVYYLVITPIALIRCMVKGSPLPLKPDKKVSSYWVTRDEPAQPVERFIKRY